MVYSNDYPNGVYFKSSNNYKCPVAIVIINKNDIIFMIILLMLNI